jgi:hypothetical protein
MEERMSPVRPWLPVCLLTLCGIAAAAPEEPERPPATVGRAVALSVATRLSDGARQGLLFPVQVRASEGAGALEATAEMDGEMTRTVRRALEWVVAQRGHPGFVVPDAFPAERDLLLQFPRRVNYVEGESAGVALACALYSAASQTPVLDSVGMTGAIDPDGHIHAVGLIRTKLDGVLEGGLSTMVLPTENWWRTESEARQVWRDAVPQVQVVFVETLEDAFFFAFGPYGPQAEAYTRYSTELNKGFDLYRQTKYERAAAAFAWLHAWHPGNSTATVWRSDANAHYVAQLIDAAWDAVAESRTETADLLARRAEAFGVERAAADIAALRAVPPGQARPDGRAVTPRIPQGAEGGGLTLPAPYEERVPARLDDPHWAFADPVVRTAEGFGDMTLAALYGWQDSALALSWADPSGTVDDNAGRWYETDRGYVERSREDRAAVVIGPEELVSDAALGALDLLGTSGCDAWVFGAGPVRSSGYACDLALVAAAPAFDEGTASIFHNVSPTGGPAGSFDGLLGAAHNPNVLRADEAGYLKGDPWRGRAVFVGKCAGCHGLGSERPADRVKRGFALCPEGSEGLLTHRLTTDPTHADLVPPGALGDVTAYMRCMEPPPAWLVAPPEGSAGDVRVQALYRSGRWWVQFTRATDTGHPDDLPLGKGQQVWLAAAARDGATGQQGVTAPLAVEWR